MVKVQHRNLQQQLLFFFGGCECLTGKWRFGIGGSRPSDFEVFLGYKGIVGLVCDSKSLAGWILWWSVIIFCYQKSWLKKKCVWFKSCHHILFLRLVKFHIDCMTYKVKYNSKFLSTGINFSVATWKCIKLSILIKSEVHTKQTEFYFYYSTVYLQCYKKSFLYSSASCDISSALLSFLSLSKSSFSFNSFSFSSIWIKFKKENKE